MGHVSRGGTFARHRVTGNGCGSDGRHKEVWHSSYHRLSLVEALLLGETLDDKKRSGRPSSTCLKSPKSSAPKLPAREGRM